MVLMPGPVVESVEQLMAEGPVRVFLTSPAGRRFDQAMARELAGEQRLIIVCGHYEGYDERIRTILSPEEVSIGDYVLTGGEIPAMVMVDAVARLVPGVLGDPASNIEDSFTGELLDHPHYTRPEVYRELRVPEVLLSGDHARIAKWRKAGAEERTAERRPDLYAAYLERTAATRRQRKRTSKQVPGLCPEEAQRSEE
jgi:tRNA (guanine37-N1)-methyltransferase